MSHLLCLCLFTVISGETAKVGGFKSELLEEWESWKSQHGKWYAHSVEELERHIIWASNRKYIEDHNANADMFGYTLAMNQFGDLVSAEKHTKKQMGQTDRCLG